MKDEYIVRYRTWAEKVNEMCVEALSLEDARTRAMYDRSVACVLWTQTKEAYMAERKPNAS